MLYVEQRTRDTWIVLPKREGRERERQRERDRERETERDPKTQK
jgi:hypothetical protein